MFESSTMSSDQKEPTNETPTAMVEPADSWMASSSSSSSAGVENPTVPQHLLKVRFHIP
jgi:hypothetical protein